MCVKVYEKAIQSVSVRGLLKSEWGDEQYWSLLNSLNLVEFGGR